MKLTNKVEYSHNLIVFSSSFPTVDDWQGIKNTFDYVINMSILSSGIENYHYPTVEVKGVQSINTLIAIHTIFGLVKDTAIKVLIHCDAGVNRSYNVVEAFNYLKTGETEYIRHAWLPDIYEFVKRLENREDIQQVLYSYIERLYDIGILNTRTTNEHTEITKNS